MRIEPGFIEEIDCPHCSKKIIVNVKLTNLKEKEDVLDFDIKINIDKQEEIT